MESTIVDIERNGAISSLVVVRSTMVYDDAGASRMRLTEAERVTLGTTWNTVFVGPGRMTEQAQIKVMRDGVRVSLHVHRVTQVLSASMAVHWSGTFTEQERATVESRLDHARRIAEDDARKVPA